MEIIEKQVEKVKEIPTDGYYGYGRRDINGKANPMIGFMKPLIIRALDKNFSKVSKTLDLIADKDGNIDIENILTEMMENLMTTNPFTIMIM